jgi:hypothetical protein
MNADKLVRGDFQLLGRSCEACASLVNGCFHVELSFRHA